MDLKRFENQPPCYLCGYNGNSYFNGVVHPCAIEYHLQRDNEHDASIAEIASLRAENARLKRVEEEWRCSCNLDDKHHYLCEYHQRGKLIRQLSDKLDTRRKSLKILGRKYQDLRARAEKAEAERDALQKQCNEYQSKITELHLEIDDLKNGVGLPRELEAANMKLDTLRKERDALKAQYDEYRRVVQQVESGETYLVRTDRDHLAAENDALKAMISLVDEALARRPSLADEPDRYAKIFKACSVASESDRLAARCKELEEGLRRVMADIQSDVNGCCGEGSDRFCENWGCGSLEIIVLALARLLEAK